MNRVFTGLAAAPFFLSVSASSHEARDPRWVKAAESQNAGVYYDADHVTKDGNLVHAWVLVDGAVPGYIRGNEYQSIIERKMFDCASDLSKIEALTFFSGRMGSGGLVQTFRVPPTASPESVPQGTLEAGLLDAVCK